MGQGIPVASTATVPGQTTSTRQPLGAGIHGELTFSSSPGAQPGLSRKTARECNLHDKKMNPKQNAHRPQVVQVHIYDLSDCQPGTIAALLHASYTDELDCASACKSRSFHAGSVSLCKMSYDACCLSCPCSMTQETTSLWKSFISGNTVSMAQKKGTTPWERFKAQVSSPSKRRPTG